MATTYYTDNLLRKSSAEEAREHLQVAKSGETPTANAAPADPVLGQIYFDTGLNQFRGWNGTIWVAL